MKKVKKKITKIGSKKSKPHAHSLEPIVIDKQAGLVFKSEKELYAHFEPQINQLEDEYIALKKETDSEFTPDEEKELSTEHCLELTLDEPHEIWMDAENIEGVTVFNFIRSFEDVSPGLFYVAIAYVSQEDEPTFVFLHFATHDVELVENYRRNEMVYDKSYEAVSPGAIDGDGLNEGDPFAIGLYLAMLKTRSDSDIPQEDFQKFADLREETIEEADEIWRAADSNGNLLVTFIKEFPDHEVKGLTYIAVTVEDTQSSVHALLYSFPTTDENLVDRFRHGENLQADEIVQESSH